MAETRLVRQSPVVSTEVLTDEQCQRVLALRAAREVIETRQAAPLMASGGSDFKDYLLLVVAQWIIDGNIAPILETLAAQSLDPGD